MINLPLTRVTQPLRWALPSIDYSQTLDRIDNWRRNVKQTYRIHHVPWYTPPDAGNVFEEMINKAPPINRTDAEHLECIWSALPDNDKKVFILEHYILRAPYFLVRRKLKRKGVIIQSLEMFRVYENSVLRYFENRLWLLYPTPIFICTIRHVGKSND